MKKQQVTLFGLLAVLSGSFLCGNEAQEVECYDEATECASASSRTRKACDAIVGGIGLTATLIVPVLCVCLWRSKKAVMQLRQQLKAAQAALSSGTPAPANAITPPVAQEVVASPIIEAIKQIYDGKDAKGREEINSAVRVQLDRAGYDSCQDLNDFIKAAVVTCAEIKHFFTKGLCLQSKSLGA